MHRLGARFQRLHMLALTVVLVGCGGNSTPSIPPPSLAGHIHVSGGTSGQPTAIADFTLPLTSASTPNMLLNSTAVPPLLAEDANGNLAVGIDLSVTVFSTPLTSSSAPFLSLTIPAPGFVGQPAFSAAGDLFVPNGNNTVWLVPHPLTPASQLTQAITDPSLGATEATALDSTSNLIVFNGGFSPKLVVFAPPYAGAPIVDTLQSTSAGTLAVHGNQLFLSVPTLGGVPTSRIDVFDLPITSSSQPAFSITNGLSPDPTELATDSAGNLYVADDRSILVYSPPFSASSSPSLALDLTSIVRPSFFPHGIAIGK